jgi:hypothetical protein
MGDAELGSELRTEGVPVPPPSAGTPYAKTYAASDKTPAPGYSWGSKLVCGGPESQQQYVSPVLTEAAQRCGAPTPQGN